MLLKTKADLMVCGGSEAQSPLGISDTAAGFVYIQ